MDNNIYHPLTCVRDQPGRTQQTGIFCSKSFIAYIFPVNWWSSVYPTDADIVEHDCDPNPWEAVEGGAPRSNPAWSSLSLSCLIATIVNHHNTGTQEKEKQSETCKLLYSVLSVNLQGCSDDSLCRLIQWSEAPVYLFRKAKVPASMQNFLPSLVSCNWHHLSKSTALWSKRWS